MVSCGLAPITESAAEVSHWRYQRLARHGQLIPTGTLSLLPQKSHEHGDRTPSSLGSLLWLGFHVVGGTFERHSSEARCETKGGRLVRSTGNTRLHVLRSGSNEVVQMDIVAGVL